MLNLSWIRIKGGPMRALIVWRWMALALYLGAVSVAAAESKIGVVVLHGKWGSPSGPSKPFADQLESAGFLVESPELPWSGRRTYDAGVEAMVADIDTAVQSLRGKGAEKVCVAGHSMGAAGAIRYAGQTRVDCLIVLAPGHNPESMIMRSWTARDLSTARDMVANGKGDASAPFDDYNSGNRTKKVNVKARVFIEYFDGDGPFNMANNANHVLPGTPVLWVVGQDEAEGPKRSGGTAFRALPETAPKKIVEVPGGHLATPEKSGAIAIEWLRATLK